MIFLLETSLSKDYLMFYFITAGSSFVALCILMFVFTEDKFIYDKDEIKRGVKKMIEKKRSLAKCIKDSAGASNQSSTFRSASSISER